MRQILFIMLLVVGWRAAAVAQLYATADGQVSFSSHTFLEDIEAVNKKVSAVIDPVRKNMAFSLAMKNFVFKRKLMQEHFNENYVESDKFPAATFSGSFAGELDLTRSAAYPVTVRGNLTIHGVTRHVETTGTFTVEAGSVTGDASFKLNPADYNIDIPFLVRDKIEKENTISVHVILKPKS